MKQSILVAVLVTVMVVFICHLFKKNPLTHRSQQPVNKGSAFSDDGPGGFPPLGSTGLLFSKLLY
jgi:hypothetical protein